MSGRDAALGALVAVLAIAFAVAVVLGRTARAVAAVVVLVASAVDALVSAWLGVRPVGLWASAWRRELADEARRGWHHAIDAEVIEIEDAAGTSATEDCTKGAAR